MTDTPNLALPEIASAQAQKHVTHNEALRALDALVQLAVLDRDLSAPPGSPAEGQRWLVKAPATGGWSGHGDQIAAWQDGGWEFYAPQPGWLAYVADEGALIAWTGSSWVDAISALTSLNDMTLLGVGTAADDTNPFSLKLNNTLFTAKTVAEGGDGHLRYKMSKESAAKTLSLLMQDGFSACAELGLTGDDDFHIKVSPDGTDWVEALVIDRATGRVTLPQTLGSDLELVMAELALGVADGMNVAQFLGSAGNRFADSFDALTYVDVAGSTNLDISTAGLLKPASPPGTTTLLTPTTTVDIAAGFTNIDRKNQLPPNALVQKIGVYNNQGAKTMVVKIVKRNSSGNYDVVLSESFSHPGGGWADKTLSSVYKVSASGAYFVGAFATGVSDCSNDSGNVRTYKAGDITGSGQTGFSEDSGAVQVLCFRTVTIPANLTVASTSLAAASAPSTARLVARVKEIDSITLNTDLIASASRNGGTNYSAFTLSKKFTAGGVSIYESGALNLAGQPSGTALKWKVTTANNKAVELHDIYFYWS